MEIRVIDGRRATDRRGAAEHLGRGYSLQNIKLLASLRAESGFPQPIHTDPEGPGTRQRDGHPRGREWYALDDLDTFKTTREQQRAAAHATTRKPLEGDLDELLTGPQIADALHIEPDTWKTWVKQSKADWDAGLEGYVPRADEEQPGRGGVNRRWRRSTINNQFIARRGAASTGRPEGGGATLADLTAVLAEAGPHEPTTDQIAAALTARLGHAVNTRTVTRLKRAHRDAASI